MRLLKIPEAAARLGVSRATVYRMIDEGEITAVVVRSVMRVPETAVDGYIERKINALPQGA